MAETAGFEAIRTETSGNVMVVTLNRPDRANTISPQLVSEIRLAFAGAAADPGVRAVIVTGAGKHFCGGADLSEARGGLDLTFFSVFEDCPKPVVAAINGAALGGGCEVALACDIRVMADDAVIGTPEIKFGALPAGGGTQRLARMVGIGCAKEMIMTGEPITATEAYRIGLVNSVVPRDQVMAEAQRYAAILAARAPFALRTAKYLVMKSLDVDLATGLQLECHAINSMATPAEKKAEQDRAAAANATYGKIFRRSAGVFPGGTTR